MSEPNELIKDPHENAEESETLEEAAKVVESEDNVVNDTVCESTESTDDENIDSSISEADESTQEELSEGADDTDDISKDEVLSEDDSEETSETSEENMTFEEEKENQEVTPEENKKRKIDLKKVGKIVLNIASLIIMCTGIVLVLYFIWGPARNEFHSDSTDTLYWAEAAMQGNGIINPDFSYAAIMPFGGNLFMQIWIPFFGISMLTHTLGMTTFFVLFTAALFWLLHEMKWSFRWKGIAIGGMLMAISLSEKLREIFWGHVIYYSLGMLFLLIGLSLVLHIYNLQIKPNTKGLKVKKVFFLLLLLAMFIFCCTNSTTAIALFALPIMGALVCERVLDHTTPLKSKKTLMSIIMLILCGAGVVLGMKLGEHLANGVQAGYATAYSHFSETNTWWEHIENLPLAFLNLNGLDVSAEYFLMSKEGIDIIMLLAHVAVIVILPFAALFNYKKIKETGLRMLIWSHFVSTAFILIGYICGGLNTANWRLSPLIVTSFLVSISFMRWIYKNTEFKRLGILLLVPAAYVCTSCAIDIAKMPHDSYLENTHYKLAQYLEENDLEYGYATFWNAQVITVQSDSKCKVRNVDINENGVFRNPYQSNTKWFEDQEGQDDYFLLMDFGQHQTLIDSGNELNTKPHKELEYLGYYIWVFEENIIQ